MASDLSHLSAHLVLKLEEMAQEHGRLSEQAADPEVIADHARYTELLRELGRLGKIVELFDAYRKIEGRELEAQQILDGETDEELCGLAEEELAGCSEERLGVVKIIKEQLIASPADAARNCIVEIRPGTGGDEAALFAADLFRMYERFAELRGWSVEVLSSQATEIGGFREIVFSVSGSGVYGALRFESGTHRVQRVPKTETSGRIHTSASTVAVLPEVEDVEIEIKQSDLRIDTYRSSGPGGQSVNKTSSAVRITHIPTGTVVAIQDEKSQHKNKAKAMRVLRSRIYDKLESEKRQQRDTARRSQIGSGDRSQRIRTYNFPQGRITDHRINLTLYSLPAVLEGDLKELVESLDEAHKEELISQL